MAEFQLASAAIGLAGNVVSLIQYLREVKAAMDTIEDDIDDLIKELQSLETLYGHLEQKYTQQPHQGTVNTQQQELWSLLRQTLQDGRLTFVKLDKEVREIYGSDPRNQGKLDTFWKQHRLRSRSVKVGNLRNQLNTYNTVLQIWLSVISQANQDSSRDLERVTTAQLQELCDCIRNMKERLEESEHTQIERDSIVNVKGYTTLTRASEAALSKVSAFLEQNQRFSVNKHFDIPQPVDSCYIGREEEAKILADCLFSHTNARPQQQWRFVIHGVGGSGKTQFCCKFAQDHQQRFWGVFWIDGRSHDQLKQSLSQNVAKIGEVDINHRAALSWLANLEERCTWLLIIDNADDPAIDLGDYFPKGGRGHVLITTRNPGYQSLGTVEPGSFKFHEMRNDEASALLLKSAGLKSSLDEVIPFATAIVEKLGYLALAIAVAGSAIGAGYCRIQNYLQYFEDMWEVRRRSKAHDSTKPLDEFDEKREARVEATFDISYRAIAKKGTREAQDALQLLKTFAFLHCENVRFEFMKLCIENAEKEEKQQLVDKEAAAELLACSPPRSWSQWTIDLWIQILTALHGTSGAGVLPEVLREGRNQQRLNERRIRGAMGQLTQYSLATHNEKADSWSMHPLVHKWAREMIDVRIGEQYLWCEAAATLLGNCVYLGQEDEELLRQLLPHVDHVRKEQAAIGERIKDKRMARMKPWPVFESSFSPQRALMLAKFSIVYAQNGRWKDAEALQSVVQGFTVEVLGFKKVNTRRVTKALADTLWHLGRGDDSARLLERLVEACIKYCGPDHRETLMAKHKLGESRALQGRIRDAKNLYEEALTGLEKLCGKDDEDTLTAMDSLGGAILLFGTDETHSKARNLHLTTFNARSRIHGPEHLKTLTSRELYCSAATWKGDHEDLIEAEKGMTEIVEIRKQKLGREHAFTLLALLNLARVKVELKNLEAAEEILTTGIPIAERNHGKEHMAVLFCNFHLGRLRARQGRWAEARNILVDVTNRQKDSLQGWGRFHYDRIGGLLELAKVHNALGEHDECDEVVTEALLGFEKITTVEHPWARKLRADAAEWRRQSSQSASPRG